MMKKAIITLLIISATLVVSVAINSLVLVKIEDRKNSYLLSDALSAQISNETKGMDAEQIIDYGLSLTANELRFAVQNDIDNGKANCVGYAQLCAAVCNQALVTNGIKGKARPVVGYIESNGINWCKVLKAISPGASYKNFVKDHDFVELTAGSKRYYLDPCIYDVLGKKCLSQTIVIY